MIKKQAAVFLDRDKTLIEDPGYLADPNEVKLLPGAADAVRRWNDTQFMRECEKTLFEHAFEGDVVGQRGRFKKTF